MPRYALGVEYDGTDFVGWQQQANGRSVQAVLADAISSVADEPVEVHGAGRTDAGVHAVNQVAHFDTNATRQLFQWQSGINSNLPDDVAVRWLREVPGDFDARRSALWREYRYCIANQSTRPVIDRRSLWWQRQPLDCGAMTAAASAWLGERDFSAFRAAHCQSKTPMRCMLRISVTRQAERILIAFRANAFVYHMVRNLVGALVVIGRGDAPIAWGRELLESRDRKQGAQTAPARGLFLVGIAYDEVYALPSVAD